VIVRELAPSDKAAVIASPASTWDVREADTNDIDDLMPLALAHWRELPWGHLEPDIERLRKIFVWGMTTVGTKAWVLRYRGEIKGFIGLALIKDVWTDRLLANEPWWYVAEDARKGARGALLLLAVAERWAREQGAIIQVSVHDERVGKLLERLSYHKTEIVYQKGP